MIGLSESQDFAKELHNGPTELRQYWKGLLLEYAKYTTESENTNANELAKWELNCDAKDELHALCSKFIDLNTSYLEKVRSLSSLLF